MGDYIVRVLAQEAGVRGLACVTTGVAREATRRHNASPAATAALSHGLTAAALMGALLKTNQRVAIKVESVGPLRKLVVESDSAGNLRGYVSNPNVALAPPIGPGEIPIVIGDQGLLTVVKDLRLKDLYEGVVPLQSGKLDVDLTYYLMHSEQVPSLVEIGAPIDVNGMLRVAGGLLLQTLPGSDVNPLAELAERLDDLPQIGELFSNGETPESVLAAIFGAVDYAIVERRELQFQCACSWERTRQGLKLLGPAEIRTMLVEDEAVVDCHFCHERYVFNREALETILEELEHAQNDAAESL
ncbi:MAG: Hsp33 family molecular chaperone HslO [Caldilineaceae bacterium]|nr:Hsp33 family molecular chaperone HslO [Caldilineaceae bacterium]